MADITVSTDIDAFMQSADKTEARNSIDVIAQLDVTLADIASNTVAVTGPAFAITTDGFIVKLNDGDTAPADNANFRTGLFSEADGTYAANIELADVSGVVPPAHVLGQVEGEPTIGDGTTTGGRKIAMQSNLMAQTLIASATETMMYDYTVIPSVYAGVASPLSIYIGASVTEVGASAFDGQTTLTGRLSIPDSVLSIGDSAFNDCYPSGGTLELGNGLFNIGVEAFRDCKFTGDLVIPNSVTTIGDRAFYGGTGYDGTLTLPAFLESIGSQAFYFCNSVTGSVIIADTVTSLGVSAFQGCSSIDGSIVVGDGLTIIPDYAFEAMTAAAGTVTIGSSVLTIGEHSFENNAALTGSLVIPDSVKTIGTFAFATCSSITGSLTLGNSVETIGDYAFGFIGCTGNIVFPDSVTSVGSGAFYGSFLVDAYVNLDSSGFPTDVFDTGVAGTLYVRAAHLASYGGAGASWGVKTVAEWVA